MTQRSPKRPRFFGNVSRQQQRFWAMMVGFAFVWLCLFAVLGFSV